MTVEVRHGDAFKLLTEMPDESVRMCVTSPPYFGLRDYGVAGQIGLEATVAEFLDRLVAVFGEVRRVLTKDGTLWLNMGDSYAGSWGAQGKKAAPSASSTLAGNGHVGGGPKAKSLRAIDWRNSIENHPKMAKTGGLARFGPGIKAKDMLMIPERLVLALQAQGWWVRDKMVWHKPAPMPSSVEDRFCAAWEPVFLLSKSERYFFDKEAAREARVGVEDANGFRGGSYVDGAPGPRKTRGNVRVDRIPTGWDTGPGGHRDLIGRYQPPAEKVARSGNKGRSLLASDVGDARGGALARGFPWQDKDGKRLMRNVWTIPPEPFKGEHYATFPTELARRCIAIGSAPGDTILDCFGGSGTSGLVADRLQRHAILLELNPATVEMARDRIRGGASLLAEVS